MAVMRGHLERVPVVLASATPSLESWHNMRLGRYGYVHLAERATREYELARQKIARFFNAESPETIVFTRGATEAINLVARSWGAANLKPGDEILLTWMEHHSNTVPWYQIAAVTGAVIRRIPLAGDGTLDLADLDRLITGKTKLVAVTHASNVLGTINPIAELAVAAHRVGAVLLADGAQAAPHMRVDVQALGCDFYAVSGHKMLGPTGIGVLYGKQRLLEGMPPFLGGGEMIREVRADGFTCNELPYKFEAGTPPIAEAIAFGVAVDYLQRIGLAKIRQHERDLTAYALQRMAEFPEIVVYGPPDPSKRSGLIAFSMGDIHPHDIATLLDEDGIAIRAGHHCAQPLHRHLGLTATARASFYLYNTRAEVDVFIEALQKVKRFFGACPTVRQLGPAHPKAERRSR
ncbi:MAG: SufS family cysteine desulfurase [Verrucomicrobiae bacterium]|nr:SufS family cysteine desulfurase [Verrucomicrobiae bacterium]